jgi:hypothetical protein
VRPQRVEFPSTRAAVQRAVKAAAARGMQVKAVGAGHSFTGIAVAPGVLLLHAVELPEDLGDVLDGLEARVAASDHFELYWFPHTDRAMTKTNVRLPESAVRHPLPRVGKWIDDVVVGNGLHQIACSLARMPPPTVPAISRASVRVWGDREFTDVSHRAFTTERSVRFRERVLGE